MLGIAMLVDRLMQYFEIHFQQHVLVILQAAATNIRNNATAYRDSLGVVINGSNYSEVFALFTVAQTTLNAENYAVK